MSKFQVIFGDQLLLEHEVNDAEHVKSLEAQVAAQSDIIQDQSEQIAQLKDRVAELEALEDEAAIIYETITAGLKDITPPAGTPPEDPLNIQAIIDAAPNGTPENPTLITIPSGIYHQQINVSGKKYIRLVGGGYVQICGLVYKRWLWNYDSDGDIYFGIWPGYDALFHHQDPATAYNTAQAYPVLCTIGDEPLTWTEKPEPGSFWITSAPNERGTIYVKLRDDQDIEDFRFSAFDRLLWGDEQCEGITLQNIQFKGCSNTQFEGAVNFPGRKWLVEDVTVSLVNSIGIELGQGGKRSNMTSTCYDSVFRRVMTYDCGQSGWQGSLQSSVDGEYLCIMEDCGHERSNIKPFDFGWNAGSKLSGSKWVRIIRWQAKDINGTGLWFDIYNEFILIEDPNIQKVVRAGIELELGASNITVIGGVIDGVAAKRSPDQVKSGWTHLQSACIVIKASSNNNTVTGTLFKNAEKAVWLDNEDTRTLPGGAPYCHNNTISGSLENIQQPYLYLPSGTEPNDQKGNTVEFK